MASRVKKTQIDSALENFYSSLEDAGALAKDIQPPEYAEETESKHTFQERKIVKNYQRKSLTQRKVDRPVACKVCGRNIPSEEMAEHVRIELMDPKYYVQRQAERERMKNPNNDTDIYIHLKDFANRRTDIFGDQEVTIGQSLNEDQKLNKRKDRDRVIWDGHTNSVNEVITSKLTANDPRKPTTPTATPPTKGTPSPSPETPISPSFATPSFTPGNLPIPLFSNGSALPPMPPASTGLGLPPSYGNFALGEPSSKRFKSEKPLLSAEDFMAQCRDPRVRIRVEVPKEPNKDQWQLNGQVLSLEMKITDTVLQLKEKLEMVLGGMKPNRQKLVTYDADILKDNCTFAEHNLAGDFALQLKVKERGGKK